MQKCRNERKSKTEMQKQKKEKDNNMRFGKLKRGLG